MASGANRRGSGTKATLLSDFSWGLLELSLGAQCANLRALGPKLGAQGAKLDAQTAKLGTVGAYVVGLESRWGAT